MSGNDDQRLYFVLCNETDATQQTEKKKRKTEDRQQVAKRKARQRDREKDDFDKKQQQERWKHEHLERRREEKQDQKEEEAFWQHVNDVDRAVARKEAREAANEGDVSTLRAYARVRVWLGSQSDLLRMT